MSLSDSYAIPDRAAALHDDDDADEVDSLPSSSTESFVSEDDSEYLAAAQQEWEESLEQMQLLLTMVLVPFIGKYFGKKFAYYSWARYMEWAHDVEIRWTNKTKFKAETAAQAAASL